MKFYVITASKVFGGVENVLAVLDENVANGLFVEMGNKYAFVETPFKTVDEVAEWFSRNSEKTDYMVQMHVISDNTNDMPQSCGYGNNDTISPWGKETPFYGHIKDGKFVFNEIDYEFDLEGGVVIKACSLQTGGMCMVDYIEMEDGSIYTLNDETIIKYFSKDAFTKEFENCEANFWELEKQGLVKNLKDLSSHPKREKNLTKMQAHDEIKKGKKVQHVDWLDEDDGLGKYWFYRLDYNGKIVDQNGTPITDWDTFDDSENAWQIYHDFDFEAHENLIAENKAMAAFLGSLGYSQEQITDIANGSKTSFIDAIKANFVCGGAQ